MYLLEPTNDKINTLLYFKKLLIPRVNFHLEDTWGIKEWVKWRWRGKNMPWQSWHWHELATGQWYRGKKREMGLLKIKTFKYNQMECGDLVLNTDLNKRNKKTFHRQWGLRQCLYTGLL